MGSLGRGEEARNLTTFWCEMDRGDALVSRYAAAGPCSSVHFPPPPADRRSPWPSRASRSRSGKGAQVVRDHPEPDPPLHAGLAAIATAPEAVTALDCTDPTFGPGAP